MNIFSKKLFIRPAQQGFTLVETLVSIAILAATVSALLSLSATGFFSVKYSKNDIVANNLLQESLEYIRNSRDTSMHQTLESWDTWRGKFNVDSTGAIIGSAGGFTRGCFSASGCIIDAYVSSANVKECSGTCTPLLFYPSQQFYGYNTTYPHISGGASPYATSFVRSIGMKPAGSDQNQLIVSASITWQNGTQTKTLTQSIIITNWSL